MFLGGAFVVHVQWDLHSLLFIFFGLDYFATNQVDLEHCSGLQCCTATQAEAETLNHQDGDGSERCSHETVEISTMF